MEKEHFEVVLESIESKVQQVLECFSVLDKKIDDVRDELKHDNGILNVKISAISGRIDTFEANLTKRIDAVHSELVAQRESVELHKAPRRRFLKQRLR
jgi:FtsZ-binding cell division protein ZapB